MRVLKNPADQRMRQIWRFEVLKNPFEQYQAKRWRIEVLYIGLRVELGIYI